MFFYVVHYVEHFMYHQKLKHEFQFK